MGKWIATFFTLCLLVLIGIVSFFVYPEELKRLYSTIQDSISSDRSVLIAASPTPTANTLPTDEPVTPSPVDVKAQPPEDLKNTDALLQRGDNFFQEGFLSLAINDFSRATELSSGNQAAWSKLINAQIALRDYDAAEKSATEALQIFSGNDEYLILLGEILIQKSEFDKAKATFERLQQSPARNYFLGIMAIYSEESDSAKALFQAIKTDREYGDKAGAILSAFEEYSLFPDGNPLHLRLLLTKALNELGFYEMAIQKAKKILEQRDDYRDAWIILGHSYLSLERYDLAKNVLQKALELDPIKPETTFFLALAESALGDQESAITHLSMARENGFKPESEVTEALADAYLAAKYYDAARQEFEKLINTNGNSAASYVQPITISIQFLQDPTTAKLLAEQAVKNNPNSPEANNLLAWALLESGEYQSAKDVLQRVTAANPDYAPAYLNLGKLAEKESQNDKALEYYKTAYEKSPHSEIGALAAENYNKIVLKQ